RLLNTNGFLRDNWLKLGPKSADDLGAKAQTREDSECSRFALLEQHGRSWSDNLQLNSFDLWNLDRRDQLIAKYARKASDQARQAIGERLHLRALHHFDVENFHAAGHDHFCEIANGDIQRIICNVQSKRKRDVGLQRENTHVALVDDRIEIEHQLWDFHFQFRSLPSIFFEIDHG